MTVDSRYRNALPPSETTIVKFTHGSGSSLRTLVLSNGINEIEWDYKLITSATPTKGGEVIQVLGASIGPVTMSGSTKSSYEMEQIRQWFFGVMHALGTGNHTREDAVLFEYPERGWSFWIVPTQFGPWELSNTNIAAEWHLTAEMVSKTSNDLSDYTMATHVGLPSSSKLAGRAFDSWRDTFDPERAEGSFLNATRAAAHKDAVDRTFAGIVSGSLGLFGQSDNPADDRSADDIYEEAFGSKWLYDGTLKVSTAEESASSTSAGQETTAGTATGALLSNKTGRELSNAIVNHEHFLGFDNSAARNDILNYEAVGLNPVVPRAILGILDAGWSIHISSVKTNRGGPNHGPGRAFDCNCYGAGAAFNHAGGTTSPNPAAFIAFLKANRANLGGLRIGYGAGSPQAGSDFADKTDHVHIDWTGSV